MKLHTVDLSSLGVISFSFIWEVAGLYYSPTARGHGGVEGFLELINKYILWFMVLESGHLNG